MEQKMGRRTWFTKRQKEFLEVVSQLPFFRKFYLTGGTALAAIYYNHRESDDLDFFSESEFSFIELENSLHTIKSKLKFEKIIRNQIHNINSYLIIWKEEQPLKVDF